MMDGTPVFDIKPYVPFADSHPEAKGGFTDQTKEYGLAVEIPEKLLEFLPEEKRDPLRAVLAQDPQARPTRRIRTGFMAWNLPDMR